jgi:hypothetical protein
MNIFLSKREVNIKFDDLDYIEMVIKGNKKRADDNRKYFLRFYFKNKVKIEFGHTWDLKKIKNKYQICVAMIKGIVLAEVNKNLVKDESIYEEYVYLNK